MNDSESNTSDHFLNRLMLRLCDEPFWDPVRAWESERGPDLGECMERTVLEWLPTALMLLFTPFVLSAHRKSQRPSLPWSALPYLKLILYFVLVLATVTELLEAVAIWRENLNPSPNHFLAPVLLLLSYVIQTILVVSGLRCGEVTSPLLWCYWLLSTLCGVPRLFTALTSLLTKDGRLGVIIGVTFVVRYAAGLLLLVLNCFAHNPPTTLLTGKEHPLLRASFLGRITLSWVSGVVWKGWRQPLTLTHLWQLIPFHDPTQVTKEWMEAWSREANNGEKSTHEGTENRGFVGSKSNVDMSTSINGTGHTDTDNSGNTGTGLSGMTDTSIGRSEGDKNSSSSSSSNSSNSCSNGAKNEYDDANDARNQSSATDGRGIKKKTVSVCRVIIRLVFKEYFCYTCIYLLSESSLFLSPRLLGLLMDFSGDMSRPWWHGYVYAVSLLLGLSLITLLRQFSVFNIQCISLKIRTAIMTAVYRKALVLSPCARRQTAVGEIVNLMAVDTRRMTDFILFASFLLSGPLVSGIALYENWRILGPSVVAGVAVMILLTPVNCAVASWIRTLQATQMKHKDLRNKVLQETINGIKVLKMFAWELLFGKQIEELRATEIRVLRKAAYLQAILSFTFLTIPYLVSLASLTTFVMVSEDNVLDPKTAFMSIALFNIMRNPLTQMPGVIALGIQANVSLKRVSAFLSMSDVDSNAVCADDNQKVAIAVKGGEFKWSDGGDEGRGLDDEEEYKDEEEEWSLEGVDLEVKKGQLVGVVGPVGAGKTSLLFALLGEMNKTEGTVIINGSVSYVSQQPWLQNATLRENITWGKPYEYFKYQKVLTACALKSDLDMLPAGDMTEVGEKGVNLSGGQKQRISLARAAYSEAEVVYLDDPLSAVDTNVGRHIFKQLIGPGGLMEGKTRILVTHAVWPLHEMDKIVVLSGGCVVEQGTCDELLSLDGHLSSLLILHNNTQQQQQHIPEESGLDEFYKQMKNTQGGRKLSARRFSMDSLGSLSQLRQQQHSRRQSVGGTHVALSNRRMSLEQIHKDDAFQLRRYKRRLSSTASMEGGVSGSLLLGASYDEQTNDTTGTLVEEDKTQKGKVKFDVYRDYSRAMGYWCAILPVFFYIIGQASQAGSNVWLSVFTASLTHQVNNQTHKNNNAKISSMLPNFDRTLFLTGYGCFGISQAIFFYFGTVLMWTGCLRAGRRLHNALLNSVLRLPMSFFDTNPSGRIMNRFGKEMDVLDSVLPTFLGNNITCFSQVLVTLLVIIGSTPVVTVVLVPVLALYVLMLVVYISASRQIKRIESVLISPIYSHFSESIEGVTTIRAFGKQDDFTKVSMKKVDDAARAFYATTACNRWLGVRLEFIGNIIIFAAAVFSVTGRGTINPSIVGLSVTYALDITLVLTYLVRMSSEVEGNIVAVERVKEYMKESQEAPWEREPAPPSSWPDKGALTFTHYHTRYRPGLPLAIKDLHCDIAPAEKIGIVGRTGAGKSSLTLGLLRMVEAAGGSITLDGLDISTLGLHQLRSKITIIPQDSVLFEGSLRHNIDPAEEHNDEAVWHALELAHLAPYVRSLPSALMTPVEESGANLSVGQKQLVGLARALLHKTRLLVLDEATAAVDIHTDTLIQSTIRTEFTDSTVLTIAHRLNTIMDSDRVLVMDQGRIAEMDSPAALLANRKSLFFSMAKDAGLVK